jgi:hypothetical protein
MFNLAIDSKLRGCDVVAVRVEDVAAGGYTVDRATVRQKKTGRPVRFELSEQSRRFVSVLEIPHMKQLERPYRLQVDVSEDDKVALDDFWFRERLPSKIVELLRRLAVERQKEK